MSYNVDRRRLSEPFPELLPDGPAEQVEEDVPMPRPAPPTAARPDTVENRDRVQQSPPPDPRRGPSCPLPRRPVPMRPRSLPSPRLGVRPPTWPR